MARDLATGNRDESLKDAKSLGLFVDMDWPDAPVRVHSGIGQYTFSSMTFTGIGDFGGIDVIEETIDIQQRGLALTLAGIEGKDYLTDILEDSFWNRDVDIYLGFFDSGGGLITTPDNIWSGFMGHGEVIQGSENMVRINCHNRAARLRNVCGRRYTDEDIQNDYTGDVFCEFMAQMAQITLVWGGERVRAGDVNTGMNLSDYRGTRGTLPAPDRADRRYPF